MAKQPATDHISGAIAKIELKAKNGKLKIARIKQKTLMSKDKPKEIADIMNDNVNSHERDEICKDARDENNPATGANGVVANAKREMSNRLRKDMQNFN